MVPGGNFKSSISVASLFAAVALKVMLSSTPYELLVDSSALGAAGAPEAN